MPDTDTIEKLAQDLRARIEWEQELDASGYSGTLPPAPAPRARASSNQAVAAPVTTRPQTTARPSEPVVPAAKHTTAPAAQTTSVAPTTVEHDKAHSLSKLKFTLEKCTQCSLSNSRSRIVFSDGTMNAKIAFVGDGPSKEEDLISLPFVGPRGYLLNKIILAIGLRRETSYLCNVTKCAPKEGACVTPQEAAICANHLFSQLKLVRPQIIVALGPIPASVLLKTDADIDKLRGQFYSFEGMQVMPTFSLDHMLAVPDSKREVWQDMKKVKQLLSSQG